MINTNFVPDDYVQANESRRTNIMYLVLFLVVMVSLGGSFMTIKMRQKNFAEKEKLLSSKMAKAQESIKQFEQLQSKRRLMMKAALTTAELLEPVPRSVLLASLTNNLPSGVSLLKLNLIQKQGKPAAVAQPSTKYKAEKNKKSASEPAVSKEQLLETHIDIEGVAPSDLQVAAYIEKLGSSGLLNDVALVESKEHNIEDITFREFKLKAMLGKEVHLSTEDIARLRSESRTGIFGR